MGKMTIYDPAMCCSTGVCGPSVSPELLRVATVLANLKNKGIVVDRFGLSSHPQAFVANAKVSELIKKDGAGVLPITMVDGEVVKKAAYPTNDEFIKWLGIPPDYIPPIRKITKKCNCGPGGCC